MEGKRVSNGTVGVVGISSGTVGVVGVSNGRKGLFLDSHVSKPFYSFLLVAVQSQAPLTDSTLDLAM